MNRSRISINHKEITIVGIWMDAISITIKSPLLKNNNLQQEGCQSSAHTISHKLDFQLQEVYKLIDMKVTFIQPPSTSVSSSEKLVRVLTCLRFLGSLRIPFT